MIYYKILIILIIIILFYLINNYLLFNNINIYENFIEFGSFNKSSEDKQNIDIIVARYNEDLKWTLEYPFNKYKYIVYNKGDNENFEKTHVKNIIKLPNVGKCDHTYLHHIIENFDDLSDIVVFVPGSLDMKYKKRIASRLLKEIELRNSAVFISLNQSDIQKLHYNFTINEYKTTHKLNKSMNSESELKKCSIRPFGKWFESKFGNIKVNCLIYYGIFSVSKNDILQHPKSRYQNLIDDLMVSNPECGHFIERSWCSVFHPLNDTYVIKYNKIR
jgi:hypothetical protein